LLGYAEQFWQDTGSSTAADKGIQSAMLLSVLSGAEAAHPV